MEDHKILIVDDEPLIIELVVEILKDYNYELFTASNGKEVIKIASELMPDIILMDWEMPQMNGIQCLKVLKKNKTTHSIPVIMITGIMNSIENLKEAFDAGAIDFINKPVNKIELVSRVRSMLLFADYFKQAIKQKEWELTIQAKSLLQNNKFNAALLEKLKIIKRHVKSENSAIKKILPDVIQELSYKIKTEAWQQFETYFKEVHPNYIDELNKKATLTTNEIRLCVFLRLNMSSKEIASIAFQNTHSVDIARYRLRKKLKLKRNENLSSYLMTIN